MAVLWLILKILLGLVAALLALVVLALLVPVTVELAWRQESFAAWLRVLFVRVRLWPRPPQEPGDEKKGGAGEKLARLLRRRGPGAKKAPAAENAPAGAAEAQSPPADQSPPAAQPERTAAGQRQKPAGGEKPRQTGEAPFHRRLKRKMDRYAALAATAGGFVRRVLAGLTLHSVQAYLPVHGENPAETAVAVGAVWAALGASIATLGNFVKLRPGRIQVEPDYKDEHQGQASFSCKITGQLIIMVIAGIWALRRLQEEHLLPTK